MSVHDEPPPDAMEVEKTPSHARGAFRSVLISFSIILCQFVQARQPRPTRVSPADRVQTIPYGAGINSGLAIAKDLGAPATQATWIVAAYPQVRTCWSPGVTDGFAG